jgi:hypothetical protein
MRKGIPYDELTHIWEHHTLDGYVKALRYTLIDGKTEFERISREVLPVMYRHALLVNVTPDRLCLDASLESLQQRFRNERREQYNRVLGTHQDRFHRREQERRAEMKLRPTHAPRLETMVHLSTPEGIHDVTLAYPLVLLHAFRDSIAANPTTRNIAHRINEVSPREKLMLLNVLSEYIREYDAKAFRFVQQLGREGGLKREQMVYGMPLDVKDLYWWLDPEELMRRDEQDWKFGLSQGMNFERHLVSMQGLVKRVNANFLQINNRAAEWADSLRGAWYCRPFVLLQEGEERKAVLPLAHGRFAGLAKNRGIFVADNPEAFYQPLVLGMHERRKEWLHELESSLRERRRPERWPSDTRSVMRYRRLYEALGLPVNAEQTELFI